MNRPFRAVGRALLLATLGSGGVTALAQGQEPWRASYFPYVVGGPTDGVMGVVRYQLTRNAPYFASRPDGEEVINPVSFAGAFSAEAGAGTRGSRFLTLLFRGPGLVDGWRFHGTIEARRDGRFGSYGLGPDAGPAGSGTAAGDDADRARRDRYVARAEVTRTLVGPLRAALAASLERTEFRPIGPPATWGFLQAPIKGTDGILRATLVLDTRDREFVPANGLLAEAGLLVGTDGIDPDLPGGSSGRQAYTGGYVHLRGYVSPREGTVLAGRLGLRSLSAGAPYSARFMMPGWERDLTVLGGVESHRGFVKGRFGGRGVLLGGAEIRHDLLNAGDFGAISLLGFVDGGRVFEGEGARLTTAGWELGYGGGVALRILRSAVLTFNFAGGGDGFTFGTGVGWSY